MRICRQGVPNLQLRFLWISEGIKDDHSRAWYGIEEKMMGQNVGFKVFLAGKHYTVLEFGRDEDLKDTNPEFENE